MFVLAQLSKLYVGVTCGQKDIVDCFYIVIYIVTTERL